MRKMILVLYDLQKFLKNIRNASTNIYLYLLFLSKTNQRYTKKIFEKYPDTKWIDNESQPSCDRFVAKTDAFVIIRDYSWKNLDDIKEMHYLAFPLDLSIICLRDLNQNHLPLLRKMLAYKVKKWELLLYASISR